MKKALYFIVNTGRWIGIFTLFSMMTLTFADVVGRYIFNHSILGAQEITDLMMIILVFFVLPYSTSMGDNLTIIFLTSRLSAHTQRILKIITTFLSIIIVGIMTWQIFLTMISAIKTGEATEIIRIPWIFYLSLAVVGCVVLTIQLIVIFFDLSRNQPLEA